MPTDGAFRIGSITKTFTATTILQLADEGILTLDDSLSVWLPEVAEQLPYGDQITLRQLLSHTAGVFNFTNNRAYYRDWFEGLVEDETAGTLMLPCWDRTPKDILDTYVYDGTATFAPGARGRWAYSNTGFMVLGMVIEAATGHTVAEEYHSRIFDPLNMAHTYLECHEPPVTGLVHGYMTDEVALLDVFEVHSSAAWTAGGLISSVPDLMVFAKALFAGQLFDDQTMLEAMIDSVPEGDYGLGLMVYVSSVGHDGTSNGFASALRYWPEDEMVVVVLYNGEGDPGSMIPDVLRYVKGAEI